MQAIDWVLASSNPGKLAEIQQIFESVKPGWLRFSTLREHGIAAPEETGLSFVENALLKARHASRAANRPALADDSGICVQALNGAPGIYSARFAGEPSDDARNNALLLQKMAAQTDRRAMFVSVCVWVAHADDPMPILGEGIWRGELLRAPRGAAGFGYDPLFFDPALNCSAAEMSDAIKNQRSHRALALAQLIARMQALETLS